VGCRWVCLLYSVGLVCLPDRHHRVVRPERHYRDPIPGRTSPAGTRTYTDKEGATRQLAPEDFLFIAPYNAQVRALQAALPRGARVGSVDKFQGQEAPVCILSLCSSYGEYGSRALAFI
jgi:hypothetical protein